RDRVVKRFAGRREHHEAGAPLPRRRLVHDCRLVAGEGLRSARRRERQSGKQSEAEERRERRDGGEAGGGFRGECISFWIEERFWRRQQGAPRRMRSGSAGLSLDALRSAKSSSAEESPSPAARPAPSRPLEPGDALPFPRST